MARTLLLISAFLVLSAISHAQTVNDYDGNLYDTVHIGNQAWLMQNLKVIHYNNGDLIPNVTDSTTWGSLTTGARCYYGNDSASNDSVYGSLYNWYAAHNSNLICPLGWRVPSDGDWTSLENFLGGSIVAGGKLKEAGTMHWLAPNAGATNSSGFTGLPGGMRGPYNSFSTINENGLWWTSTTTGAYAWSRYFWNMYAGVDRNPTPKRIGMSIRCMKDLNIGIGSTLKQEEFKVYPNPSKGFFTIENTDLKMINLQLYTSTGVCIIEKTFSNSTLEIDISSLPKGIYLLKASNMDGVSFQKIIKE